MTTTRPLPTCTTYRLRLGTRIALLVIRHTPAGWETTLTICARQTATSRAHNLSTAFADAARNANTLYRALTAGGWALA